MQMPPVNHELGYTEEFLKSFFGDNFPSFKQWMMGKTVSISETCGTIYYAIDVYNFCNRPNIPKEHAYV